MIDRHIDEENAALYALGTLSEEEYDAFDRHAESCDACAAELAKASATVDALEARAGVIPAPRTLVEGRPRRPGWPIAAGLAAAAILAVALLVHWMMPTNNSSQDIALPLTAIVHSHFYHAPFTPAHAGAPPAKVLFARDGTWVYVIVDRPATALRLVGTDADGRASNIATIAPSGTPQTAFAEPRRRIVRLDLRDIKGGTISSAELAYPK